MSSVESRQQRTIPPKPSSLITKVLKITVQLSLKSRTAGTLRRRDNHRIKLRVCNLNIHVIYVCLNKASTSHRKNAAHLGW